MSDTPIEPKQPSDQRQPYAPPIVEELSPQEAIVRLRQELHAERLRAARMEASRDAAVRLREGAEAAQAKLANELVVYKRREARLRVAMAQAARNVHSVAAALALDVRRELDTAMTPTPEEVALGITNTTPV